MKSLNKQAMKVFAKLIDGLDVYGHRQIDNAPDVYMPVTVEVVGSSKVEGSDWRSLAVSLSHYGEQNGDLMRDPEMIFKAVWFDGELQAVVPVYFRNDYLGSEQWSVTNWQELDAEYDGFYPKLQADQARFANTWMKNIKAQQLSRAA